MLCGSNAGLLSIGLQGTNFSEIRIRTLSFSFRKMHPKLSSAKMSAILSRRRWIQCRAPHLCQSTAEEYLLSCDVYMGISGIQLDGLQIGPYSSVSGSLSPLQRCISFHKCCFQLFPINLPHLKNKTKTKQTIFTFYIISKCQTSARQILCPIQFVCVYIYIYLKVAMQYIVSRWLNVL